MSFFSGLLGLFFGNGRNVVKDTVEVFRPNAEASAQREATYNQTAMTQYAAEFHTRNNRTWLDSLADGLNRLVRPVLAIGIIFPLFWVVIDPDHMVIVFAAWGLLPVGYWAILGGVQSFYFAGRMQIKGHDFQKGIQAALDRAPDVLETIHDMQELRADSVGVASGGARAKVDLEATKSTENAALGEWRAER